MNEEWVETTLDDVALVNPREPALSEDAPFITMADVDEWGVWATSSGGRGARSGARARAGDTLMARITPCLENGKIAMVPDSLERVGGSTEFIVLRAGERVLPEFLFRWAASHDTHHSAVDLMVGTSGRKRVSGADIAKLPILLPPLVVQRRIVDLLESLDTNLANLRTEHAAATEALNAWLWEFVDGHGDSDLLVGDVCSPRSGPSWAASEETKEPLDGSIRVIKITNTRPDGMIDLTDETYVAGLPDSTLLIDATSLVIIRTNGNRSRIGNTYLPGRETYGSAVSAFQFLANVNAPEWRDVLYWFLRAPQVQARMSEAASGTTGLGNLAGGWLKKLPLPDATDQDRVEFAGVAFSLDGTCQSIGLEIQQLETLRTQALASLLSHEVEIPESYDDVVGMEVA